MKINENVSLLIMLEKSRLTADGKAPIFIRLTVDGKRAEMSLGQKVHPKSWNQENHSTYPSQMPGRSLLCRSQWPNEKKLTPFWGA